MTTHSDTREWVENVSENPMNRGAWWATVHGVTKSWTQMSTQACKYYYYCQFTDEKTEAMQGLIIYKGHTVTER